MLKWLNGLEEAREVLKEEFKGEPVSEMNLSNWRQGGYQDWERHDASEDAVRRVVEES